MRKLKREIASMWNMTTVRASDTGNLEKLLKKLNIKTVLHYSKDLYKGVRRYTLFSSELVIVNNIFS